MFKKLLTLVMISLMICGLAACGNGSGDTEKNPGSANAGTSELKGYVYKTEKDFSIAVDMDMSTVLATLGEPLQYFEAASCAFEGKDKMYTYEHIRIETYPNKDKDYISSIFFLDDIAETAEGVTIGMSKADMESAYGTDYTETSGVYTYIKDGKMLKFILNDDEIKSIEYVSDALSTQ